MVVRTQVGRVEETLSVRLTELELDQAATSFELILGPEYLRMSIALANPNGMEAEMHRRNSPRRGSWNRRGREPGPVFRWVGAECLTLGG